MSFAGRSWICVFGIMLLVGGTLARPGSVAAQQPDFDDPELLPRPYTPEEFARPLRDLRRFTVIGTGAFPVTMFFSGLIYEFARFGYYSIESGEARGDYAPLFFGPSSGPRFDADEQRNVLMVGVGLSLFVATLDFVLGRIQARSTDGTTGSRSQN